MPDVRLDSFMDLFSAEYGSYALFLMVFSYSCLGITRMELIIGGLPYVVWACTCFTLLSRRRLMLHVALAFSSLRALALSRSRTLAVLVFILSVILMVTGYVRSF